MIEESEQVRSAEWTEHQDPQTRRDRHYQGGEKEHAAEGPHARKFTAKSALGYAEESEPSEPDEELERNHLTLSHYWAAQSIAGPK
jgi:hypothetical protein